VRRNLLPGLGGRLVSCVRYLPSSLGEASVTGRGWVWWLRGSVFDLPVAGPPTVLSYSTWLLCVDDTVCLPSAAASRVIKISYGWLHFSLTNSCKCLIA